MKRDITNILFYSVSAILLLIIIGFTSTRNSGKPVNNVLVKIKDQNGDFFTDQMEILDLLNAESTDYVLGLSLEQLDLKMLERRVEAHPFVKDAQVFRDVKGNIMVNVSQAQPIARIFRKGSDHQYIDSDGNLLPTITRHTARVPMIELEREFSWEKNIKETDYGQKILSLLEYIDKDDFWRAQIAGLLIEKDGEVTLLPQVSKQDIRFGMPEDFDEKFRKLKIFYKEILPNKGWNTYSLVNLKFKNQIVCE